MAYEFNLENPDLDIYAEVRISDFELEDKVEWEKWLNTYPLNSHSYCDTEEPARALLINLLTQVPVSDVTWENGGTIILHF